MTLPQHATLRAPRRAGRRPLAVVAACSVVAIVLLLAVPGGAATTTTVAGAATTPSPSALAGGAAGAAGTTATTSPQPPFAFTIGCSTGQLFSGTITASGTVSFPNVPDGANCTVVPTPNNELSSDAPQNFAPVPPAGVSQVTYTEKIPSAIVDPPDGPPGMTTEVIGAGFPADELVSLNWQPGEGGKVYVETGKLGQLSALMNVVVGDTVGPRHLVISGNGFAPVQVPYLVVTPTAAPFGPGVVVAFR